jgi:hypothetical protein
MYRRIVLSLVVIAAALIAPGLARADMVTQWNQNASTVLMGNLGQPPQQSVPHLAMVHGAAYDAVNAIDGGHEGYLLTSRIGSPFDSKDAAAATAAYRVLYSLVPDAQKPLLDGMYAASLEGIPDGVPKTRGIAIGEAAGAAMIAARTADGRFGPPGFPLDPPGPGVWEPTPPGFVNDPNAWLRNVTPFLVESSSQFRTAGPDPLRSRRYARDFNEVKDYGRAGDGGPRSEDQTTAARYWAENPPGTWSRIFRTLSAQEEVSLVDNARLYAMLYLTAADALISAWDDKAYHGFWRPITAIRRADTDGNPRTEREDEWSPDHDPAVSRASVRSRRAQRLDRGDAAGLLPHRPHRLDGHQQRRVQPQLHALLRRHRGRRRRAGLVGDPLPQRRRAGCAHRPAGRELSRAAALLPSGSSVTAASLDREGAPATGLLFFAGQRLGRGSRTPNASCLASRSRSSGEWRSRSRLLPVTDGGEAAQTLGPGDAFGEIALLLTGQRTATVQARTAMRLLWLSDQGLPEHPITGLSSNARCAASASTAHVDRRAAHDPATSCSSFLSAGPAGPCARDSRRPCPTPASCHRTSLPSAIRRGPCAGPAASCCSGRRRGRQAGARSVVVVAAGPSAEAAVEVAETAVAAAVGPVDGEPAAVAGEASPASAPAAA